MGIKPSKGIMYGVNPRFIKFKKICWLKKLLLWWKVKKKKDAVRKAYEEKWKLWYDNRDGTTMRQGSFFRMVEDKDDKA